MLGSWIVAFLIGLSSPQWELAHRSGRESCWASFHLNDQKRLCLSHAVWMKWLQARNPDLISAAKASGSWKSSSVPQNFSDHSGPKKVFLTQYVQEFLQPSSSGARWGAWARQQVERIRERSSELLAPVDRLGIVRSLFLNEATSGGALPIFRRVGFVHLVTASGIHLYAVLSWTQAVMFYVSLVGRVPVSIGLRFSRFLSFGLCIFIWILAGARLGLLRPAVVILLRSVARQQGVKWRSGSPLVIVLSLDLLVSLMRGESAGGPGVSGRWIYALAVGGGIFWHDSMLSGRSKADQRENWFVKLGGHVGLALGSWVLVAVVEIWETGLVSVATPFLSLVTLPWVCLVIYPSIFVGLLFVWAGWGDFGKWILCRACQSLEFCVVLLNEWVLVPGNLWMVSRWGILAAVILATFIFVLAHRRRVRLQLALALAVGICVFRFFSNDDGETLRAQAADRVVQLDVGQGDSTLVLGQTAGLIDAGSEFSLAWDDWIKVFAKARVSELSWVALTHLDEDHAGGLLRVSKIIPIRCVATAREQLASPRGHRLSERLAEAGLRLESWEGGCVPVPTLGPDPKVAGHSRHGNENMSAVWVPLRSGGFYLSAGDADQQDEIRIGHWARERYQRLEDHSWKAFPHHKAGMTRAPRLLKVSHHGSRYSTSDEFLNFLNPTEVWISAGQGNRYGHPSVQTLDLLSRRRLRIRRTDHEGSISSSD